MADVFPQLIERIEAIEKHLSLDPVNSLSVATLEGTTPGKVDQSGAPATKLDVANATGETVNPDVDPATPQPGFPPPDATGEQAR
jgi:hypothetical protein